MGNKVKMAEVHNLHDSVSNALNKLSTQTSTLKTNIENLKGDDNFKGQTANSINNYNQNFHIETINRLDKIKEEFETKFKSAMEAFHADVDNDHSAILNKNAMETYKDEIDQSVEKIEQTKTRINSTIGGVHDLTSAKTISESAVKDKGKALTKHIKNTINDFESFQNSHDADDIELLTMIAPVATMTSKVKDMPSNRSTIAKNSAYIKSQYTLHSKNNQFAQMKAELEKYGNAVYGGKKYAKYVKNLIEMKKHLVVATIAGDGDMFKGNRLLKNNSVKSLGQKKMKLMNSILNTNVENIKDKKMMKAAEFLMKNPKGMKVSDKFINAMKMTQNFDDKELKSIRKVMEKPNAKSVLKSSSKEALNEIISENTRNLMKNPKNIKDFTLKELEDFKAKNMLGKGLKSLKVVGKGLGPLAAIAAVGSNVVSEKSAQKKVVDSAVDLGAIAASTGTATAVGATIGGPLGAGMGLVVGAGIGVATELKIFGGKSATDIAKEKANQGVNATKGAIKDFGKSLGTIF
ncbi:T7SS effector LXG polymorphic toxin [Staphylococcus xylosus]